MFHRHAFLCRAVSPEPAGQSMTLKEVQTARLAHRRRLRAEIKNKTAGVAESLPGWSPTIPPALACPPPPAPAPARPRLRTYAEDGR